MNSQNEQRHEVPASEPRVAPSSEVGPSSEKARAIVYGIGLSVFWFPSFYGATGGSVSERLLITTGLIIAVWAAVGFLCLVWSEFQ